MELDYTASVFADITKLRLKGFLYSIVTLNLLRLLMIVFIDKGIVERDNFSLAVWCLMGFYVILEIITFITSMEQLKSFGLANKKIYIIIQKSINTSLGCMIMLYTMFSEVNDFKYYIGYVLILLTASVLPTLKMGDSNKLEVFYAMREDLKRVTIRIYTTDRPVVEYHITKGVFRVVEGNNIKVGRRVIDRRGIDKIMMYIDDEYQLAVFNEGLDKWEISETQYEISHNIY